MEKSILFLFVVLELVLCKNKSRNSLLQRLLHSLMKKKKSHGLREQSSRLEHLTFIVRLPSTSFLASTRRHRKHGDEPKTASRI